MVGLWDFRGIFSCMVFGFVVGGGVVVVAAAAVFVDDDNVFNER